MSIKSIPLKTWEVQAILDGPKSTLRRAVKMDRKHIYKAACAAGRWSETFGDEIPDEIADWYAREVANPCCHPGDILWVRETFCPIRVIPTRYAYRCEFPEADVRKVRWNPSIHMPREAARLFLRVKSVRVERFSDPRNSTSNPADIRRYGWDKTQWVFVLEFERCEKPEGFV